MGKPKNVFDTWKFNAGNQNEQNNKKFDMNAFVWL